MAKFWLNRLHLAHTPLFQEKLATSPPATPGV
jgi:hypothetical protein